MFEDTTKRLQSLQEQMQNGTVKERVVVPLSEMIEGTAHFLFYAPSLPLSLSMHEHFL
jgi:hypothetical protein